MRSRTYGRPDTFKRIEEVMNLLDEEITRVVDNPKEHWYEEDWWEDWMEDIAVYPCTVTHVMTTEERDEIKTALTLLNHHTAPSREEYISRISSNFLALRLCSLKIVYAGAVDFRGNSAS